MPHFRWEWIFFIFLLIIIGSTSLSISATPPKPFIFRPLHPDPKASPDKWIEAGASKEVAVALIDYEHSPSMKTAIGVLRHFRWFASLSNQQRQKLFDVNPKVFQTIDAAKFELALQTSLKLDGVDHMLRFGSSGERFLEWMKWAKTHDLDKMPALNPSIQFKSDDDICHLPKPALLEKDPLAGEAINGARAAQVYRQITEAYGAPMYPEEVETNFLSATKTYDVLVQGKYGPLQQTVWPSYLQAWVNSDPEKYNGIFAEERMRQWCLQKGVITTDLQDPTLPTMRFNEFVKDPNRSQRSLPDFLKIDDLDVWIANNHRMIFQVHKGDTHSFGKYVLRMIAAYEDLNVKLPGDPGLIEKIKKMAQSIYRPTPDNEPSLYAGPDAIRKQLDSYCRRLVIDAHQQHINELIVEFKRIRPKWGTKDAILKFASQVEQAGTDKKGRIYRLLNNLALTYANLDPDLQGKLRAQAELAIQLATSPTAASRRTSEDVIRGMVFKQLLVLIDHADISAKDLRKMSSCFRRMRGDVGKLINDELYHLADITLDDLLVKVAKGEFTEKRLVWDQGGLHYLTITKQPTEVEADLELFKAVAETFGWDERKYAERVLEYFKGHVSEGIEYLQLLHRIFDPRYNRPIRIAVPDNDGNIVYREIRPSAFNRGVSLGILFFKAGIKGYSIWGDIQSGNQLFEHLRDMYGGGKTSADIQALQARALSQCIGLVDYADVFKAFGSIRQGFSWPFPTATLATVASFAGGDVPLDKDAFEALAISGIKDLCCVVAPELAVLFAVYDITSWAYNKYALSSAEDDITKLLLENGKWDFKRIGDPKFKDQKHPELVHICIAFHDAPDKDNKASSASPTCWAKIPGENYRELAKKKDLYERGILTMKSRIRVSPRKSLLEIAYRKNYLDGDPILKIYKEAAINIFPTLFKACNMLSINWPSLSDPRNWTKENLEKTLGIHFPADLREDALHKDPDLIRRISAGKMGTSWIFTGLSMVPVNLDSLISANARRVFAAIVVDYWIKRQHILEGPVLDAVISAASRQAFKDEAMSHPYDYKKYYVEFIRRAQLLDEKVWEDMADSAIPNYKERHSKKSGSTSDHPSLPDPDKISDSDLLNYDPGPEYPITRKYLSETRKDLKQLIRFVEWLNKEPSERKPMIVTVTEFPPGALLPRSTKVELGEPEVKQRVKTLVENLTQKLLDFEKCYDSVVSKMQRADSFVNQGDSYSLKPKFHLVLNPSKGPKQDLSAANEWLTAYKQELANTEYDIAQYLRDRREKRGVAWVEDIVRRWTGYTYNVGEETDAAHYHPRWSYLLRLRFQIRKLKNIQKIVPFLAREEFVEAVHNKMVLHDEPLKVPELRYHVGSTPNSQALLVEEWIDKIIKQMEDEYTQLIVGVDTTFEVELKVQRGPSAGPFQVLTYLDATATLKLSKKMLQHLLASSTTSTKGKHRDNSKDRQNQKHKSSPSDTMTPEQKAALDKAIQSMVQKFRWRVYDKSGNDIYLEEVKKKKITNPSRWLFPLLQAGHFFLEFTVLGKRNIILGQKKFSLRIRPASLEGKIKIWGDWPYAGQNGKHDDTIDLVITCCKNGAAPDQTSEITNCDSWGYSEILNVFLLAGRDQVARLIVPVKKIDCSIDFIKKLVESQKMDKLFCTFRVYAKYGTKVTHVFSTSRRKTSDSTHGQIKLGLLLIDDDSPLEIYAPYEEPVYAKVTDASGDKTKAVFRIYLNGKVVAQSKDLLHKYQATILIPSRNKQIIHAEAERTIKPKVKAISQGITFDPNSSKTIEFQIWLPFFNRDNLKVKGCFIAKTPDSGTVKIKGGIIRSNIADNASVPPGGCFLITNGRPWSQMDPVRISAMVWCEDNQVFKTKGELEKGFAKPGPGDTIDFGDILVYRHEVEVKPIRVKVLDWAGRSLPEDKVEVTIGDKNASWDGNSFVGSWRFKKRGEEVTIKAALNMPDGKQIVEQTVFTIDDTAFLKDVFIPPDPVSIRLKVFYPFTVFVSARIDDPNAKNLPTRIALDKAKVKGFSVPLQPSVISVDRRQAVHMNTPIPLGTLVILKASSPVDKPRYEGTGTVIVPHKPGAVDVEIVLTPRKKQGALTIASLNVTGQNGKGKPRAGKGMIGTAVISVGDIDVPMVSLQWIRRSDNFTELQVIPIEKFKSYPVRQLFPPLANQVRYDTLVLKISDAGVPPQEDSAQKDFEWAIDTDKIIRARASVSNKKGENIIEPGDDVNIWVRVKAADDYEGIRTLKTLFRGQRRSISFPMNKGQTSDRSLVISTKGLKPSIYSARVKLFGPDDELQDTKLVRFTVQKKKSPNDTGLTDVTCSSSRITIKFWDHATQDNDIVVIRIGKNWQKTVNLNGCGGPNEPTGGPCVLCDLPLPRGGIATITVTALNEGSISPNTAALKIEGGCNPQVQHWNLKTGQSASITIRRGRSSKH